MAALLAVAVVAGAQAAGPAPGWPTYGGEPGRTGAVGDALPPTTVKPAFVLPVTGRVTSQVLAARDVPAGGVTTLYVATSAGRIYAVSETGYVRWRVDLGQLPHACPQLDGYGITGTPAIDPATRTLYAADALGRLHALDLATGAERSGWPVVLYPDPARELAWGALAFAGGRVYVPTGSYCDAGPFQGKVISVDVSSREVSTWTAVPVEQGGGGGIWGWGGVAYSSSLDSLFIATGNAFEGGSNTGDTFSEAAGFGESVVALSPALEVRGASHPVSIDQPLDLDFVGSPVVVDRPGCGELVLAQDKNAQIFAWKAADVGGGPLWSLTLETFDPDDPVLSQLAWDPKRNAAFAVTGTRLVRVDVAADCSGSIAWTHELGTDSLNGSPTVAGGTVWFGVSAGPRLLGVDTGTGETVASLALPGLAVTAPTVLDGRIFVPTFTGQLVGFSSARAAPAAPGPAAAGVTGHSSWIDARHGWVSRETGVWATDDGGARWRQIFAKAAVTVVRTSVRAGVIRVPAVPSGCTCAYDLWTVDGGLHWTATRAIGGGLIGRGGALYWVAASRTAISRVTPWPPAGRLRSQAVGRLDGGTIRGLALLPDGIAALARDASTGDLSVLLVQGGAARTRALPSPPGTTVAQSLRSSGSELVVDATVLDGDALEQLRWTSTGDPSSWTVVEGPRESGNAAPAGRPSCSSLRAGAEGDELADAEDGRAGGRAAVSGRAGGGERGVRGLVGELLAADGRERHL